MDDPTSECGDERLDGADLCVSCLQELFDGSGQCPHCGCPVEPTAAMSPLERVHAEGFIYRQAIAAPRSLIVVWGIGVVFSTFLIFGFVVLFLSVSTGAVDLYSLIAGLAALLVGASGLWQCIRNYRHSRA